MFPFEFSENILPINLEIRLQANYLLVLLNQINPMTATTTAAKAATGLTLCNVAQISAESTAKVTSEIMIISVPKATVLLFKFNTNRLFMLMLKIAFSDLMLRFRTSCSTNRTDCALINFLKKEKFGQV